MKKVIANIKLAPGNRGYFDPLTGINLTIANSIGYIYENDNVNNIRKAIREGKIKIVGGQLPPAVNIKPIKYKKKNEDNKPVKVKKEEINKTKTKETKKEKKVKFPIVQEKKVVDDQPKETTALVTIATKKKEEVKDEPVKAGE